MATTPTKRTLDWLRSDNWHCQVVEHWNPFARRRIDLFGGIDILAIRGPHTLGVQCTTVDHQANRIAKLREMPAMQTWLEAGNLLWVVAWSQRGKKGRRKLWTPSVTELSP